jgi:integrase
LGHIRRFAIYLHAEDARHQIPPQIFGKEQWPRPTPYILSDEQICRIIQVAAKSGYRTLRRQTYSTFFALLACTGLRVSEAINLKYDDITADGLIIRATKFRKNRLVPLHQTARAGLERYLKLRRPYAPFDDHIFISLRRKPLLIHDVETAFQTVIEKMHLPRGRGRRRPTPHSLRHAFAVRALQNCPDGRDRITQHMLMLSMYLGHSKAELTYWYLEAVPDLMRSIAARCESHVVGGRP